MNLNSPLFKVPAKFGAFGAAMVIVMFCLYYFTGLNPLTKMGVFDFFIIPIFLFFGIKEFKDSYNKRLLEFWQGMTAGFTIYFTLAMITSIFIFIFINLDERSTKEDYVADRLEILKEKKEDIIKKMGIITYEQSEKEILEITVFDIAFDNFLKKTLIGLLLTIMIAVIMRRKPIEELT
ncbi:MAG: DUF4199 domain-containing protein [Cyclobacteriaceae bacterium]|nr:DUF4199 domain-containing protein [Cyclobacteriaceae bacterium]